MNSTARGFLLLVVAAATSISCQQSVEESAPHRSEGTVQVDGVELNWIREGEGPPLFVIGSAIYYPRAYSEQLREHFELIFVDGRHFTPDYSPPASELDRVTLATFAADVEAVRKELGYGEISVVGHSIHGQIALEYADRYPESTDRVILIAAVPYSIDQFAPKADSVWQRLASDRRKQLLDSRLEALDSLLAAAPGERSWAVGYRQRGPLYWANPEYDASSLLEGIENGPAFTRLVATIPGKDEARARLHRIEAPILLVLGRLDFAVPYTAWEEIIEGVDGIDYILLEEDSHNPQTEHPSRFDQILIDWFGDEGVT